MCTQLLYFFSSFECFECVLPPLLHLIHTHLLSHTCNKMHSLGRKGRRKEGRSFENRCTLASQREEKVRHCLWFPPPSEICFSFILMSCASVKNQPSNQMGNKVYEMEGKSEGGQRSQRSPFFPLYKLVCGVVFPLQCCHSSSSSSIRFAAKFKT